MEGCACPLLEMSDTIAANEKVFAMAGYSLNVPPEQMPIEIFT